MQRQALNAVGIVAIVLLACAACSKQGDESSSAGKPGVATPASEAQAPVVGTAPVPEAPVAAPLELEAPATLTDVSLVAAEVGGAVEELTGFYGPGLTGNRLIDGLRDPAWFEPIDWSANMIFNENYWIKFPCDIVFSFNERQPALVGTVAILPLDALGQKPKDSFSIVSNETTAISLDVEGDRFVLKR